MRQPASDAAEKRIVNVEEQTSGTVLMVRPANFGFNAEAARSNAFAHAAPDEDLGAALHEFDAVVDALIAPESRCSSSRMLPLR